ncbi:cystathionine gamma-synthase [Ensifer sp. SSB1]|jgi:cystathionine gamma-synthase|uniref:cystathionine gamma-synthase n=1 Tax=Ensifer sp. SSB1 TaxID=2795385 RepID=UPI001A63886C|nr:cystathionine gamma-synthase [Ensifer sp. SSB1]MBK5571447.1 cystathionine gamma-synthase [Ensifer sp. SSB1]
MEIGPRDARTIAAVNGIATDSAFGAVTPPIYLSSNYAFPALEAPGAFEYSRTANPTRSLLSETLALLEGGAGAVVTSSGMAAINLLLDQLNPGQKVVAPHDCYGGVYRLLASRQAKGHFDVQFVDQSDHASVARACSPTVTLVLIETPSNPLMRVTDIGAIAEIAHSAGAKVAVDNTFLSPALQRPIAHGADFVVHSTTKYLNGHSDVVGGVVVAANAADVEPLRDWANLTGVTGSPFDSYLTLRGIRSLFARIERQQITAMALAEFLEAQPQVSAVHYPGLASHSAYGLACRQQLGFGAMLSFDLHGGLEAVRRFVSNIRLITLAESLGGVESLIAHPATMTHASMGAEARLAAGIGDGLLRMSVGLESERDLKIDLAQAFTAT